MKEYFIHLDDPNLAYFAEGTQAFNEYRDDMLWAQRYAYESRAKMNVALLKSLAQVVNPLYSGSHKEIAVETINCHHNYTAREHHLGRDLWVTRKGAIKADTGDMGVIPGSMGTDSYIVRGKGNPASYNSSSHGAGRRLSRGQAKRELDPKMFADMMAGKTWNSDKASTLLDEAPGAYKDIKQVMADQADLTEIVHTLHQVFNYKGTEGSRGRHGRNQKARAAG
jgi:RNA-splicing ligase RtcB